MELDEYLLIEEMPARSVYRARRRALGLTQAQLAARVGTTQSVIAAVETGHRALSSAMEANLREALRAHPAELLERHRDRIVGEAKKLGFESIKVFGSVAQGNATGDSDLDFFVKFPDAADHDAFAVLELRRRLENLLSVAVDIMSIPKNPENYGGIYKERHKAVDL